MKLEEQKPGKGEEKYTGIMFAENSKKERGNILKGKQSSCPIKTWAWSFSKANERGETNVTIIFFKS
jgi:hypothetical protein